MQAAPSRHLGRENSTGLSFPTLPDDRNLRDWLDHSSVSDSVSQHSMASHTDESSVDENVSSVGESTWDLVDGASVVSEEASYGPGPASGQQTEGIESVHLTNESFSRSGEVISTPSETSDQDDVLACSTQFKGLETSESTPLAAGVRDTFSASQAIEASQAQLGNVRVDRILSTDDSTGTTRAYAHACTFDEKEAIHAISNHPDSENVVPHTGRLHMGLKDGGLEVKDTFRLLYFGPKEMKSDITKKIGSALAANPRRLFTSEGPGSARVTVVPISSCVDDSSPEVAMIESGGFDMIIEECVDARTNSDGTGITIDLESGSNLHVEDNVMSRNGEKRQKGDDMPDLGIIYLPEKSISDKEGLKMETTSLFMTLFFINQGLPIYTITDADWLDKPKYSQSTIDKLSPHRTIETLVDGKQKIWKRVPIDITTFLALDAAQLHQNLVALKATRLQHLRSRQQSTRPWSHWMQSASKHLDHQINHGLVRDARQLSSATWLSIAAVLLTLVLGLFLGPMGSHGGRLSLEPAPINTPCPQKETITIPKLSLTKGHGNLQVIPTAKALGELFSKDAVRVPPTAGTRKKTKQGKAPPAKESEPQRSMLVRVVGESHILIRSSKPKPGPDNLNFESKRKGKQLEHKLQKIDNEYYVLEIPAGDAYGLIEIRIWTSVKPAYNETFDIDLGFPWLKVKGWKEMAEETAEKAATEAQALQKQLWSALRQGSTAYEDLKQSETATQMIEKLRASMVDLDRAARTGSANLFHRSLRNSLRLRKQLSKTMRKLQRSSARQSRAAREQQKRLNKEMLELYRLMGDTLAAQRVQFKKTLNMLQKRIDTQFLSNMQEKRLRRVQKSLLRAWWKVGGRPEQGKARKKSRQQV